MKDYQNVPLSEIEKDARLNIADALFEMAWCFELMPVNDRENPVERCAWQDYWWEKAADVGHIDARSRYADSLMNRSMNAEDRLKAMCYFWLLSDDFENSELNEDQKQDCVIAKIWLGVMLCEGYYTPRDPKKGTELIKFAEKHFGGFGRFGYRFTSALGEVYATGLAQLGEEPSIADLEQAIKYFDIAIKNFNPEKNDPNNRGYLQLTERHRNNCAEWIKVKKEKGEDTVFYGAQERRRKMMEIPVASQERLDADKKALARLRERLAREGW